MPFEEVAQLDTVLKSKVARLTVHMEKCERGMALLKSQLAAVELTLGLLNSGAHVETPASSPSVVHEVEAAPVNNPASSVDESQPVPEPRPTADEILAAYNNAPSRFTIREIISGLDARFAESDLVRSMASNFLRRMEDGGRVRVVERGTGRRPSTYIKTLPAMVHAVGPTVPLYPASGSSTPDGAGSSGNVGVSEYDSQFDDESP